MTAVAEASPAVRTAPLDLRTRGPVPDHVDVAVVGCGLGGLTAAAYLARRGKRVACFDSHYVAGGCATQFARRNASGAYRFDIGLHYIGDCGPGGRIPGILSDLGIEQEFLPLDPDGFDVLDFPDFRFRIPVSVELYRQRLLELFPAERRGIDRYLSLIHQMHTIGPRIEANEGRLSPGIVWEILRRGRLLPLNAGRTIAAFLDSCTRDQRLRAVLLAQHGDYGLPPSEAAALLHIGVADHYFRGAYYPRGGGQILSDKIASAVEQASGTIHLRMGVEQVLMERGHAIGLRTEPRHGQSHEVRADVVISGADLKRTYLELIGPEQLPPGLVRRVRDYGMGGAVFLTCLGVRTDLKARGWGNWNLWQFDDYDSDAFYTTNRGAKSIAPRGCYITSASLKDPLTTTHAPPGITSLEVMAVLPGDPRAWEASDDGVTHWSYKRNDRYHAVKQRIEDDLIARLERLCPGVRDTIVYRESATPLSHTRFTRASGGTGYGLAMTPNQVLNNRPDFRTGFPGLYLAGASTRAHHGIMGAMMSGEQVAKAIVEDRKW